MHVTDHLLMVSFLTSIQEIWCRVHQISWIEVNLFTSVLSFSPSEDSFVLGSWNWLYQNIGLPC